MIETGLVSTIIPVFNRPGMLSDAVASVLAQTYRPIEIIVVDDGSTDETPCTIQTLVAQAPDVIVPLRQDNAGPGAARETGRAVARGEFIQYLDSDDLLLPEKFSCQVAALRADPSAGIAYGKTQFARVGEIPRDVPHKRTGEKHDYLFPLLLEERWWSTSTPLYRRSVTDAIGPWSALMNEEDWEYESRAAARGVRLAFCDVFVSVTRSHEPEQHLCFDGSRDPRKLADRARAHASVFRSALAAGLDSSDPVMRRFARSLFLLCRQCGSAGLRDESGMLFALARKASGTPGPVDLGVYRAAAAVLGWCRAARLAQWADRLRA